MRIRIGDKLRSLRGQSSQASIAKAMGVSQPCWQAWETNKRELNATTIHDICKQLNCSADWLLGLKVKSPAQDGSTIKNECNRVDCSKCDLMKAAIKMIANSNQGLPRKQG